jgi:EAL domain-containing protein (putative c-di-GMP-specific phosphodiesterase class I)
VATLRTGISERAREAIRRSWTSTSGPSGGRLQATAARLLGHARTGAAVGDAAEEVIRSVLRIARRELGMDAAFVAQFRHGHRVIVAADDPCGRGLRPGDADELDQTYCQRVVDGRLPELVPDTAAEPVLRDLPITADLGIRSHIGVPVCLPNGQLYGTFCCFGSSPRDDLDAAHVGLLHALAAVVAAELERDAELAARVERRTEEARQTLVDGLSMAFQPIVDLRDGAPVGYEALARFAAEPYRPPNEWFDEAARLGLGTAVELRAINLALEALPDVPRGAYLSVNASARAIESGLVRRRLQAAPCGRLVVEVTEYERGAEDGRLAAEVDAIRDLGARIGLDDTGAGYSGLTRLVQLRPDVIKLDRTLITGLAEDPARRAVAAAIAQFAETTGATAVAEGIETRDDLEHVERSGITVGQGYLLGRPGPLDGRGP